MRKMPPAEKPNQELEAEVGLLSAGPVCKGGAGLGWVGAIQFSSERLSAEGSWKALAWVSSPAWEEERPQGTRLL